VSVVWCVCLCLWFRALVGPRFNDKTRAVTFTSVSHPTVRANKRAVLELLQNTVVEAKNLAQQFESEAFEAAQLR